MQCYTELTPPTAVTHAISLSFVSAKANNLVVAKSSLLQIFTTKSITQELDSAKEEEISAKENGPTDPRINDDEGLEASFLGADSVLLKAGERNSTKLVLIAEYQLSGTITSLGRVKTVGSKSGGETLIIGSKDAKLSLVEWDPQRQSLSTVSIHYYEQDELQGSPWTPRLADSVNYLAVDPGSRCAALKFGARNLAILPFKQGDEDVNMEDDWDEDLDGPRPAVDAPAKLTNGNGNVEETPYGSSFVLRLLSLDPGLIHPIHLAFLHEYREPTFGILSSTLSPSSSLLFERKDHLTYMVFTLDLHQRASTTILSVTNLPYDLYRVIPLPPPVGGALLVGINELIHVDQAGKANGVGVNTFAKQCTSFGLHDQSELEMRLEGCTIEQLSIENGEMLIILYTGELAILSFRMDGRSVSGLSVRRVAHDVGGAILPTGVSCTTPLGSETLFLGSEEADSVVLGWSRKLSQLTRKKSRVETEGMEDASEEEFDDDEDDDLYGDGPSEPRVAANGATSDAENSKSGDYTFRIHDSMLNIASLRDVTFGKPAFPPDTEEQKNAEGTTSELEIVGATGGDLTGSLAILHREVHPKIIGRFEFPEARGIWTISAKKPSPTGLQPSKTKTESGDYQIDAQYDKFMIVSKASTDSNEVSDVYALTSAGFEALTGTEFEPAAGSTIEAGTLGGGMRIIQVLKSEVRSYDGDFGLAQILPMFDEETQAEPKIVGASLADPFILLIRDDSSVFVAKCDDNNELEELEKEDETLLSKNWLTGCLYVDTMGVFKSADKAQKAGENVMTFLLDATGALYIYSLPDLSKPVYVAEGLCYAPPLLLAEYTGRKSTARETFTEILVADLGDTVSKSPYLIVRTANDDLTIYEPFRTDSAESPAALSAALRFAKVSNPHLALNPISAGLNGDEADSSRDYPMRVIENLGGYSAAFLPGASPSFILKSSKSLPRVIGIRGTGVRGMSSFHTEGCNRGFIYADNEGIARVSQLPPGCNFTDLGVSCKKVDFRESIHGIAYHPPMESYVIGTSTKTAFDLPKDDDHHREWQKEDIQFRPTTEQGYLKLISPVTWEAIDTIELEQFEMVMCVKTLNLEVSEETHERKQLITVGTAISRGEDLPIKGRIYVYDIVTVVPEQDRPETNKKLKLIAKEEVPRGAITGISEIGTQGFMIVAQGQKCMVRGLKEDGTLLPVAFMDMNCYVTAVKELRGTGLCVLADAVKGLWFTGYTEEPYKMLLFGKTANNMEVMTAELLPDGRELYIVAADADCNLHILQYDPEHPKSLHGHLLLHRTSFSLGAHLPTTMTLLPRTSPASSTSSLLLPSDVQAQSQSQSPHQILLTTRTGSLALLTPLSESQYRRLGTLTSHLTNTLSHACGLNPRAYRTDRDAPEAMVGGRQVVDGDVLRRWMELGTQRRSEVAGRVGVDGEEVREELVWLRSGLLYF
ncbi:CPSF A subunit region-domain-containing protein [Xylogone sp. PMI_703]|nr:CPSF A subunit region-domain-containing protein [Xylogone sp. PMI_703]